MERSSRRNLLLAAALGCASLSFAQTAPAPAVAAPEKEEDVFVLSPFVVDATQDTGYQATQTLAGTRIRTNLADVGSAISVLTKELITDIGGYNNQSVLAYAVNTEVSGSRGNFSGANRNGFEGHVTESGNFNNPNANTRVRGLTNADSTRDFFLTDVPWDGYNVSRIDLQRGPNAILFGLGSPAGVINHSLNPATFQNKGSVEATFDKFGTQRYALDYNHNVIDRQLGIRVAFLNNEQKFQQKPAFSHDRRAYAALKFAPAALNRNGVLFEITGNIEHGEITSNMPRSVPPEDLITPFWKPISEGGVDKATFSIRRDNFNQGQPYYAVVQGQGGGSLDLYLNANGVNGFSKQALNTYGALRPNGSVILTTADASGGPGVGNAISGWVGMNTIRQWSSRAGLPFSGVGAYQNATITDPSVFDFYNKLIDGPNKQEWAHWNVYTADLSNTFFDNMVGYNVTMFQQQYHEGNWTALGWDGNAISIDVNELMYDGTPNPNVGRAFIGSRLVDLGNNVNKRLREAYRGQAFAAYDFSKRHSGVWAQVLGEQRITGMMTEEDEKRDLRSILLTDWDMATKARFQPNVLRSGDENSGLGQQGFRYYVSGDLRSAAAGRDLNISGINMPFANSQGGVMPFRYFDATWTAPASVDPGTPWVNPLDPDNTVRSQGYFQSNNPANYRGWVTGEGRYITMFDRTPVNGMSVQDYLTQSAQLTNFNVKSKVAVYQGTFWNHSIIGIYGQRTDKARNYDYLTDQRSQSEGRHDPITGSADVRPSTYNFDNPAATVVDMTTHTKNWSVALHVNRLLPNHDYLPFNLRLFYNEGENFQPEAGRMDAFGRPLSPPGGTTVDKSIMISTKDDRYTMRLTQYKTSIQNATATDGQVGNLWAIEQILGGDWNGSPAGAIRGYLNGRWAYSDWTGSGGDAEFLRTQIAPAWLAFERDLRTQFPDFVRAWFPANTTFGTDNLTTQVQGASHPTGMEFTEDSVSKGYELELTGNPTRNWRIAVNASKTEASRTNVPGAAFAEVAAFMLDRLQNTPAGRAPIWWHQNTQGLVGFGPWVWTFRPELLRVAALNGQSAGEVRKYRANAITNYTFDTGMLKGVGVGAGYRWEDKAIIGYAPIQNADGSFGINLNRPFYSPREDNLDLWVSYSRKLSKDLRWRIQLNAFNVGGKNKLVPFAASVDPVAAAALTNIGPETVIPMKASSFAIRQGMSWQLSNTIEF